ncbi:50S ribosomal protein L25/general stress protein Ctc [Nocardia farcinica]|uniref:Large ribosomal subunit protein bL25 n=1 Tax=Nocardia farcinica (strain IFM 10152) TaxID=247156 RepID=RL25_NOCFA|nr:50S ribosomal protein L25/general stress protein Ctc [Nocardia farcinica]Q5YPZ5.1 RecName: Full=Large ribosomal subunit protein bL25; AltName: Full=50S ribosomal protein L25; AltName: Full=General stress protein CTC [Nocardia farcinica IFM 10152]MBF6069352.1 50S ribosomal protein L25/general stress protein Ctc [Nocardia farcinica]MBF6142951.1 50S ribosomal protein L25/general stress protein Ctc [Nocardia farcinica]MBF6259428.1 50S ribosomal protein L25/general stress protein Ctc [Nocardia fa
MSDANLLEASVRTEFGKGAARRTRRAGNVPAVLYGHQSEPQHLSLNAQAFAAILREHGTNAVLNLDIEGKKQLALTKSVVVHPIRRYIEHADLLIVKRGEKVTADVAVTVTGDAAPGTLVTQEATTISIEAEALNLPEAIEVSVEDAEIGTQITAGSIALPQGVTLASDPELLVVNVIAAPAAEPAPGEEAAEAEGESAE